MVGNAKEQRLLLQCTLAVVDAVKGDFMLHTIHALALSALLPCCGIQEYFLWCVGAMDVERRRRGLK